MGSLLGLFKGRGFCLEDLQEDACTWALMPSMRFLFQLALPSISLEIKWEDFWHGQIKLRRKESFMN
jgi:hypothetical protein